MLAPAMDESPRNRDSVSAPARPRLATLGYLGFVVLCWACNWPIMKLVLPDIGPVSFAALRLVGAAATIGLLLALKGERLLPARGEAAALAWTGFLQIGCLFTLNMLGVLFVPPGRASVLVYTMPLWATVFGIWLGRERADRGKLVGGLVGFVGLAIFFDPRLVDWRNGDVLFGNFMLLLSALGWALGAVLYRRRHWQSGFWAQVFWQLLASALPVGALALLLERGQPIHWTTVLLSAFLYTCLIGTGLAYWCWAKVLTEISAATAGQAVMLVPVIAFLLSALIFGETVTPQILLSVALILAGVLLTLRASTRAPR